MDVQGRASNRMRCLVAGLCAALLVSGCANQPNKKPVASAPNLANAALIAVAKPAIEAANADWPTAMRGRDAHSLASTFAETAVLIPRAGPSINGRAAIEHYYRSAFENSPPIIDGSIVVDGLASSTNLVYEWGHGTYTVEKVPGQPVNNSGFYLAVWQADTAGSWKIVRYLTF